MIKRRDVLGLGAAAAAGGLAIPAGRADAQETEQLTAGGEGYSYLTGTEHEAVPTTCAMCASRCAAIGYVDSGYVVKLEGNPESRRTLGKLCAKGQASVNQVYDPDRILRPMRRTGQRGDGEWEQISWDDALEDLSARLSKLRDDGHPERFMFHHGWISAGADRLINKVFLPSYGTATIADNSCLGQSARSTAQELTWGGNGGSWDFDNTRYVLNFGSNVMEADTNHVALARRLSFALTDGNVKMVTFDVRLSNTAARSHTWIQVRPGTDLSVVLAMCNVVMTEELYRGPGEDFLEFCRVTDRLDASRDEKIDALKEHLADYTPEWAEEISGVGAETIREIAVEFAAARPACVISSRGASAHYNGVETERAIQMLAAITGNIDNPGGRCLAAVPEWVHPTGPEDKLLARRLEILDGFDDSAALPIYGVGHQVLRMIKDGRAGRPEVYLWYNHNPVLSNGNIRETIDILKDESLIPFTVAVTPFYDESAALADLILPDAVFLETFDFEDGPSPAQVPEYAIRQPVVPPRGEARDFKDVCCDLAQRMGFPLGFESAEEFVDEACKLTPDVQKKARGFSGMTRYGVWQDDDAMPAFHSYRTVVDPAALSADGVILDVQSGIYWNWEVAGVSDEGTAASVGYFGTPGAYKGYVGQSIRNEVYQGFRPGRTNKSGYFELYSATLAVRGLAPLPSYVAVPEHEELTEDDLVLTSFRVNVQTLSRSQNCMWLDEISTEDSVWIHPETAALRGVGDGDRITITSKIGEIEATAKVTENVVPGVIAMSSHGGRWEYGRYASGSKAPFSVDEDRPYEALKWWNDRAAHPNWIIDNAPEPVSGQQRYMDTVVSVSRIQS
ncbi:molybdopterin-dependent oxidoreductase [Tropicimonas sp. IMCC6043]|uniref:molybdopterin-containing oxidoreductase family protein n=1 Tax=Tropicimonas sp. IMCC6043 TaxID=2510645 RepID=UPI00101C1107|nr:molybdopterin-dependent oxidoreductase [Tropicimonas sp. IMCC6043]RYH06618.1 DMSO reductase [Tropicimonas sp. IMCC6043]